MPRIDPAALSRADASAMLAESLHGLEAARIAGGIATGKARRQCASVAAQHHRNALALADRLYGSAPADILAMG